MLTMLVVDDEYLVHTGLKETIDWDELGINIVGNATNGEQAYNLAMNLKPDIILTDICMPVMTGLELMNKVKAQGLNAVIVVLSGFAEFQYVQEALNTGAAAYLLKPIDNAQLADVLSGVARKILESRSTRQYYLRLQDELSSIKKQFILDVISGTQKNENEIAEKLKFFNLPIGEGMHIAVHIFCDGLEDLVLIDSKKVDEIQNQLQNMIPSHLLLSSSYMGVMVEIPHRRRWTVLVQIQKSRAEAEDKLYQSCMELSWRFRNETGYTLSIGISQVQEGIPGLYTAACQAEKAADAKLISGINSILHYSDEIAGDFRREINDSFQYIRKHYAENITVDVVAKELFISPSYLMHLFKNEVGKTFNECLTEYRILVAKEMLRDGHWKIYEISSAVGYGDVKYFSQVFRKVTGMIPRDYMRIAHNTGL